MVFPLVARHEPESQAVAWCNEMVSIERYQHDGNGRGISHVLLKRSVL